MEIVDMMVRKETVATKEKKAKMEFQVTSLYRQQYILRHSRPFLSILLNVVCSSL